MKEEKVVTLENGKKCIVIHEINIEGIKFVYLVNENDLKDFTIRKEINNELIGLKDEAEFEKALAYLVVHQKDIK